jgi:hypothetical protein
MKWVAYSPVFSAPNPIPLAVFQGDGLHLTHIAARTRLRHGESKHRVHRQGFARLDRAEPTDQLQPKRVVGDKRKGCRWVGSSELFHKASLKGKWQRRQAIEQVELFK